MNIRYQVFVSSTYEDLQKERAEVMQALLELDCMPAGMELFPAASEEQWRFITNVIDQSDYYIVLVGGKYGSTHPQTGLSYTEMEYRYAIESGKPCIGFLIDKSTELVESRIEIDSGRRGRLEAFKELVQKRLCKYWSSPADLGAKVSRSMTQIMKHQPAKGWIRVDEAASLSNEEILSLRNRVLELERDLEIAKKAPHDGDSSLAQGDDPITLTFDLQATLGPINEEGFPDDRQGSVGHVEIQSTWNAVAAAIAPAVLNSGESRYIHQLLLQTYYGDVFRTVSLTPNDTTATVQYNVLEKIKIQFIALGYVRINVTQRQIGMGHLPFDEERWIPTQEGIAYFGRQAAVKRHGGQG